MNTRALLIVLGLCLATTCFAQTASEIGCDGCRPGRCTRTRGDRVIVCRSCEAGFTLTRLDDRISRVCIKDDDGDEGDDDDVDVKPGLCPAVVSGSFGCEETCESDGDCDGAAKCCETACGKTCVPPEGVEQTEPAPVVAEPTTIAATPVSVPVTEEPAVAPAPEAEVSVEEPTTAVAPAVEVPAEVVTPAAEAPSVAPAPEVDSTIDEPAVAIPPAMEVVPDVEEVPSVDAPAPEASTDLDLGESPQIEVMEEPDVAPPTPTVEGMTPSIPQIAEDSDSQADADLPDEDQEQDVVASAPTAPVGEEDEEEVLRELDGMDS